MLLNRRSHPLPQNAGQDFLRHRQLSANRYQVDTQRMCLNQDPVVGNLEDWRRGHPAAHLPGVNQPNDLHSVKTH